MDTVSVTLPAHGVGPVRAITRRLVGALAILLTVVGVVLVDRDGYRDVNDDPIGVIDAFYYATVTLSTTGYGDVTPASDGARLVNVLVVTPARILFLIILVGTTLEVLTERSREQFRRRRWRSRVRDHVVVCGYGTKGRSAVTALLEDGTPADHIVVVERAPGAAQEATARGLAVVKGSSTRAAALKEARVGEARAIIVAANADDAAVLTVLTARELAPKAWIVAAVRETENISLVKQSGADQVVVSSATAGRLLGLSTSAPQVVTVVGDLLTHTTGIAPSFPLVRQVLDNGLRVLLAPDRSSPVVAVAVYYDVGIRSEPEGRTGFAHLFEHLMFQGSANLEKLEHFRYVQSSGGTFNGSTHLDYTNYFEVLPSNALSRALFLEADRMRSPRITTDNLQNQIAVVKEEIRVNVMNRPYGGFPWLLLPPVLFDSFANAHNGYGDFVDLESATVEDAADFFDRYYAPANAVLTVVGDFDPDEAMTLVREHFEDIPARSAPVRPDFAEPDLDAERRKSVTDPLAPLPAFAAGWRVPDPVGNFAEYLPFLVLGEVLTDGDASRLEQRLVQKDRTVTQVATYLGLMGDPFDVRDPTAFLLQAHHAPTATADQVLDAATEEFDRVATDGLERGELERVRSRLLAQIFRDVDPVLGRTQVLASAELIHGRAELLAELPARLAEVTPDQVRTAAATLRSDRRAVLEIVPGGAQ